MKFVKLIHTLVASLLVSLTAGAVAADQYTFTHLGYGEGVSGSHIFTICQTPDNIVWWSTKNTVDCFNGNSVRTYRLDEDIPYSHFAGRTIGLAISQDGQKDLYAYDNKGRIFRYNPLEDRFIPFADIQALNNGNPLILNHILVDSEGIWLAMGNGTSILRDGTLHSILDNTNTNYILPFQDNGYLLCTWNGVFRISSPEARAEFFFPCQAVTGYYDIDRARIWLGTFSSGVFVLETNGNVLESFKVGDLPDNPVRSIIALDDNTVLAGVDGFGVFSIPSTGWDTRARELFHANEGSRGVLHGNGVYSLLKDSWGDIFIGTYSGGVDIARPKGGVTELAVHNSHINCVAQSPAWGTVLGTDDGVSIGQKKHAPGLVVLDICEDDTGNLLLATFGKGIHRMDRSGKAVPLYSKASGQLEDDYVYSFCRSSDGNLWMGCLAGDLVERTPDGFRYYPVNNVQDIVQLPDGRMAIGTADGIKVITPGSPVVEDLPYLPEGVWDVNRYVLSLFVDGNSLWIASDGGGLYILDLGSGKCRQFTQKDGLPCNGISSIVKDHEGTFWIGTENGLCRMDANNGPVSVNHIWALNREYTKSAALLLPDGQILFGSTGGAVIMNPAVLEDGAYPAPLRLIGASFNTRSEKERADKMVRLTGPNPELKLRYRDNTFELNLESVNLRYQKDIAYQYRMDGGDWSRLFPEAHFRFAEVEAGAHIIEVRCISKGTGIELDQLAIKVHVAQPLWNTWWMWMIYGLLIAGAFVGAWKIYQLHSRYMRLVLSSSSLHATGRVETIATTPKDGNGKEFVDSVTRIVLEHLDQPGFSIDDLCREMGMSRTYLYMRLKAFTGESPQDFIRFIRLEKAAVMLRNGEPVARVSEAVGFDNPKYFSTVFKKYFGVSPSKYR